MTRLRTSLVLICSSHYAFITDFEPLRLVMQPVQSFGVNTSDEVISVHQGCDVLRLMAVHHGFVPALCEPTARHEIPHLPLEIRGRVSRHMETREEESDLVFACSFFPGQFDTHLRRRRSLKQSSRHTVYHQLSTLAFILWASRGCVADEHSETLEWRGAQQTVHPPHCR